MTFKRLHPIALAAGLALVAGVAQAGEIRVMCYQDGVECDVTAEQAKRFEAQNPGTKVVIDVVPYKTIVEQLPVQLAAGEGPDIARVTNLGGLSQYYMDISANLKDRKYWDANFGATAGWLAPKPNDK
ncbi:MAG: extracellular solute-binding protein, partial [Burkholderiaceae bacterium]|nr:extracellular solute-binding protein [Burkholderiaceae bacterium]